MRREQRLTAATIAVLAVVTPLAVAAVALAGVASPALLGRISFNFATLNLLTSGLMWVRLLATALLAIPVMRAH